MSLIEVERIKLVSTRSPYWCVATILLVAAVFALIIGLTQSGTNATVANSQSPLQFGVLIFMVLATLTVTTEYRFATIRSTFLAAPVRATVLLAKTAVVAVLGAVTGLVAAFLAWGLTTATAAHPQAPMALSGATDWRLVAGQAAVFAIAGVIAVSVGVLIRQSAGAITLLLVWPLVLENLVRLIPSVGQKIHNWLPFTAGFGFVQDRSGDVDAIDAPSPVVGLLVFLATAVVLWIAALVVLRRRDA